MSLGLSVFVENLWFIFKFQECVQGVSKVCFLDVSKLGLNVFPYIQVSMVCLWCLYSVFLVCLLSKVECDSIFMFQVPCVSKVCFLGASDPGLNVLVDILWFPYSSFPLGSSRISPSPLGSRSYIEISSLRCPH